MHTIYVLKSLKDNNFYIGCTSDIKKRLREHNNGEVKSTKPRKPFVLIFEEEYLNKYQAFNKEKYYKTAKGKRELKRKLKICGVV